MSAYDMYEFFTKRYKDVTVPIKNDFEYLQDLYWLFSTAEESISIYDGALEWANDPHPYVSYFMDMFETKLSTYKRKRNFLLQRCREISNYMKKCWDFKLESDEDSIQKDFYNNIQKITSDIQKRSFDIGSKVFLKTGTYVIWGIEFHEMKVHLTKLDPTSFIGIKDESMDYNEFQDRLLKVQVLHYPLVLNENDIVTITFGDKEIKGIVQKMEQQSTTPKILLETGEEYPIYPEKVKKVS